MRMISKEAEEVFGLLNRYAGSADIVDTVMARLGHARLPVVINEIDKERAARIARGEDLNGRPVRGSNPSPI